ncbi:MAG: RDD family protein, partial [Actinomycetes bacterium]
MTHQVDGADSGLVTGDAVVVDLRLAKLPSRTPAFIIDLALQLTALIALTFLVGATTSFADEVLTVVLGFVGTIAVIVGYPVITETLTRGRTIGKLAIGLRVVRDDGGAIRFRHALARGLMAVVEIYLCFGAIAVITSLLSPQGKRVGDYLAGTVVVRERAPKPAAGQWWLPPSLQPWAASL